MEFADSILVLAALLALAVLASGLGQRLRYPFSVLLVLFGMLLGAAADNVPAFTVLHSFQLTPELVFFLFLPTLIFESGFNLDARALLGNLPPVLMMAIPALLLSALFIGGGLWLVFSIPFGVALLFGVLISATDPVAVINLFRELGAPLRLTVLVEGESLFNDATALVGFHVVLAVLLGGGIHWLNIGGGFMLTLAGGVVLGAFAGWFFGELMRKVRQQEAVLSLSLILAYSVFIVAEHLLHVSGVVATLSAALTLAAWGKMRMPREMGTALTHIWEFLAYICNAFLFLLIGLSVSFTMLLQHLPEVFVAILLVLIGRGIGVYSLIPATTRLFSLPKVSTAERHIIWWGGLKGGLAIAMALAVPKDLPQREMILSMTAGVVLFSLFVNATTIRWLMHLLKLDALSMSEVEELHYGQGLAKAGAKRTLTRFQRSDMLTLPMKKRVRQEMRAVFGKESKRPSISNELHHVYTALLRAESERLEDLFDTGVAPQYALMDLSRTLRNERDLLQRHQILPEWIPPEAPREMSGLLSSLREYDLFIAILVRYQNLRLARQIVLRMVRLSTTEAALDALEKMTDLRDETKRELKSHFSQRLTSLRQDLECYRFDFPLFFKQFSYNLSKRAVLSSALFQLRDAWQHGQIGGKVFHLIAHNVSLELQSMPPLGKTLPAYSMAELLDNVPLFAGLSSEALQQIANHIEMVLVLSGDHIITQGQKGHALYIIEHGVVEIVHTQKDGSSASITKLEEGAFFGEIALFGEQIRTCDVIAIHSTRLLRITRQQILKLAKDHPDIATHLQQAAAQRQHDNDLLKTGSIHINN